MDCFRCGKPFTGAIYHLDEGPAHVPCMTKDELVAAVLQQGGAYRDLVESNRQIDELERMRPPTRFGVLHRILKRGGLA